MFHSRISLNSVLLLLFVNLASGFKLQLMYISLTVSINSNLSHLHSLCCCYSSQKSFFRLYQQNKFSESKVNVRQASNCSKRFLKAAKLAYATKTKESITSQKLGSMDFWQINNSVLNKGKSAIPPLFNGPDMLSSASNKAKIFAENFIRTLILKTLVSAYLLFLLEII